MRRAKALVLSASLALLFAGVVGNAVAYADTPDEASPIFQADPPTDPFYSAEGLDLEGLANGTVLKTRELGTIPGILVPHDATQLLVRSTDSKDRPIAAVTTVVVPLLEWAGQGPRPLLSEQLPINSLGSQCNPSTKFENGQFPTKELPPVMQNMLSKGYAVSVPDHLGPRNAYSAGPVAGHVVNDTALAALSLPESGLAADSPVAFTGYSGGAIATGWAAGLAPAYAPMLNLVGSSVGGTPSDYSLLPETMDRGLPLGLLASAAIGLIREYPELEDRVNMPLAAPILEFFRNQCQTENIAAGALPGALGVGLGMFSTVVGNLYDDPVVKEVMEKNRMGQLHPEAPVLAVHGSDQWIPLAGAEELQKEMCDEGVNWEFVKVPGEHITAGGTSLPLVTSWLTDRLNGVDAGDGCAQ